jgi:hypothetical protein
VIQYHREAPSYLLLARVLVGEPDPTSPGHALVARANLLRDQQVVILIKVHAAATSVLNFCTALNRLTM